ncbi:MAG TPA: S41 family peptidase [Thermotogota bacterium]|nr:S41 family peptidase [Thermotogota bacterium]HRW92008.1 S41 family peptidase [Thermotogota bacterium]
MRKSWKKGVLVLGILLAVFLVFFGSLWVTDRITLHASEALKRYEGELLFFPEGKIPPATLTFPQAQEDLEWFAALLKETHPALGSKDERERLERGLPKIPEQPVTVEDFSFLLSGFAAQLDDAHTAVRFFRSYPNDYPMERVPMEFQALSDGIVVSRVLPGWQQAEGQPPVEIGMKLLSIQGKAVDQWKEESFPHFSAENTQWKEFQLALSLSYGYFLDQYLPTAQATSLLFTFQNAQGQVLDVNVPKQKIPQTTFLELHRPPWGFEIQKEHDLGYFWLDSCAYTEEYLASVDAFFQAVKQHNVSKIAVDLRSNTGGDSMVAWPFLQYMGIKKTRDFSTRVKYSATTIKTRHITAANHFLRNLRELVSLGNLYLEPPKYPENIFEGEVFLLVSGQTFSSGNFFPVLFSDNHLATIVGEPTGNEPSAYGNILTFFLPNSHIPVYISYKKFTRPDPSRDPAKQLDPDVLLPWTVEQYQQGIDPQLEWVQAR